MNKLLLACLVVLALLAPSAEAAQNAWTVTGPKGGKTLSVAYHPTRQNHILVSTENGIYRSTDGGTNWSRSTGPSVGMSDVLFDPSNPNRVFALSDWLWRSDDAGLSFSAVEGVPRNLYLMAIDGNGQIFASDAHNELYRSSNQGASWTQTMRAWPMSPGSVDLSALAVDPNTPGTVYVGFQARGIYKSTDSGASWSAPAPGPGSSTYTINAIAVNPGNSSHVLVGANDGVFRSTTGGMSWSQVDGLAGFALAINPDVVNTNEVIASTWDGRLIRSTDGGATFPHTGAYLRRFGVRRLAFDPLTPGRLLAASEDGPMLSVDDGDHFQVLDQVIHAETTARFSSSDDGTIYAIFAGGPHHVYMRDALGWHSLDPTSLRTRLPGAPYFYEVATAPQDSAIVYAVGIYDYLLKSVDGGITWSNPDPHFIGMGRQIETVSVDPSAANTVYIGTRTQGVLRTTNGGMTWSQRNAGLPAAIGPIAIDRANPNLLYAGGSSYTSGGVYRSTDAGMTWLPTGTLPATAVVDIVIDPADSAIVYASTRFNAFRSTNSGASWTPMDFGDATQGVYPTGLFIDPVLPSTLIFASGANRGGFLRSVDSGATWEDIPWPEGYQSGGVVLAATVDPLRPGNVIMNGHGGGILEYEVAPDLALELSGISSPLPIGTSVNGAVSVRNLGPHAASAAVVRVTLPPWLSVTVPPNCGLAAQILTCNSGPIRRNQVVTFPLALSVAATPSAGQIIATLLPHDADPVSANNTRVLDLASTLQNTFELAVATPATTVDHGAPVQLVLTGRNLGPSPATNTQIALPLGSFTFSQAAASGGGTCAHNAGTVTCSYSRIEAGAQVTMTVDATAATVGSNTFAATMSGAVGSANAAVSITTRPVADFSVLVSGPAAPVTTGANYQYTITIRNNGPDAAPVSTAAAFSLATTTGFTGTGATCTRLVASIECTTSMLAVNESATIVVDVIAPTAGAVGVSVNVTTSAADRVTTNNSGSASTTANAPPAPPRSGGGGGGSLDWLALGLLAGALARRGVRARRLVPRL